MHGELSKHPQGGPFFHFHDTTNHSYRLPKLTAIFIPMRGSGGWAKKK
jgi:hypothetical protein